MTTALTSKPAKIMESTSFLFLDFDIAMARAIGERDDAARRRQRRQMPQAYGR
jgi:hypothetical protein